MDLAPYLNVTTDPELVKLAAEPSNKDLGELPNCFIGQVLILTSDSESRWNDGLHPVHDFQTIKKMVNGKMNLKCVFDDDPSPEFDHSTFTLYKKIHTSTYVDVHLAVIFTRGIFSTWKHWDISKSAEVHRVLREELD